MIDKLEEALKDERCWFVYVHTNKINNKRYVGITSQKPESRWRGGKGYKQSKNRNQNLAFYNAINKYGWDTFEHEIIASNLTCDEANEFEITLIRELDSHVKRSGYNTTEGGKGTKGCNTDRSMYTGENATHVSSVICLNTMEVFNCAKIACDKYGIDNSTLSQYLLGRKKYKSCGKSKTGEKLIWEYYDDTKPMEYYIDVKESKLNTLKVHDGSGANHTRAKSVICITTGEIFSTTSEAGKKYKTKSIYKCCSGESKHAGKHPATGEKLVWMYLQDYNKLNKEREVI